MNKQTRNKAYPQEFREQVVKLVQAGGQTVSEIAREFEISTDSVRRWLKQAERDAGSRQDGLSTPERKELGQLRRDNRQLRMEREILAKAAAWFARETDSIPSGSSNSQERTRRAIRSRASAGCWESRPAGTTRGTGGRPVAGNLRGASRAGAAASGRGRRVAAAGSAADAGQRTAGRDPAAGDNHSPGPAGHGARTCSAARSWAGP